MDNLYLFYDDRLDECKEVKDFLDSKNILYTMIPACEFSQATLCMGACQFEGIEKIKRFIMNHIKEN